MRKKLLAVSVVVVLSILATGCSREVKFENKNFNSDTNASSDSQQGNVAASSPPEAAGDSSLVYARVGEKVRTSRLEITLNSARFGSGQKYFEPENGNYLILNFTFTNISNESVSVNSLTSFELQGSDLYMYSTSVWADLKGPVDGDIGPGKSLRGEVAFDVPNLQKFEVRFREEMFGDFLVTFNIEQSRDFNR
jgi:hypothetical protein